VSHRAAWVLVLALVALPPDAARGHQAGLSYGTWTARGHGVALTLRMRADELAAAFPELAPGGGRPTDPTPLARAMLGGIQVWQGGVPCAREMGPARWVPPDGLELSASFQCPDAADAMRVRMSDALSRLPPGHVHLAKVEGDGGAAERVADAGHAEFEVAASPGRLRQAASFLALGVEHIFTGWDHIAFLLGLLLAAASLRDVLRSLTAFTAAHALTLALGTLHLVRPPASLVEPLIAASVVFVAVENLRDLRRGPPGRARIAGRPRWPLALAFGLVHGFGFAGALEGLRLSGAELAVALGSFNVGVELGQAAIALAVFPALGWLRRAPRLALPALPAASAAVAAAGLFWLAERLPW
jgi:hydrogenase/urease accessory protein HupE